jgi:ABC-type thiamine transport system ATPase subunit
MARLALVGVSAEPLLSLNATFEAGRFVVLGTDAVALSRFVELVAGVRSPRRGAVLLDEQRLDDQPLRRRRVAALLGEEALPVARDVTLALGLVLRARDDARSARELLQQFGLAELGQRSPTQLSAPERRALALALALSHEKADVIALYEPFAASAHLREAPLSRALERAEQRGAIVLVCVHDLEDARRLGGSVLVLDPNGLVPLPEAAAPGGVIVDLRAKADRARELAASLAADPAVTGVRFDERREPGVIELSGTDAEALASSLARHAVERGVALSEIRVGAPPLEALLAARAAVARRYYEASYASIAPPVAAPVPAPSGAPAWAPYVPETQTAPRPPDQSVAMPTEFADPRGGKPGSGEG